MPTREQSYQAGLEYLRKKQYPEGMRCFLEAARPKKGLFDSGPHPLACSQLGAIYMRPEKGYGIPADHAIAFHWLTLAESRGIDDPKVLSGLQILLAVIYTFRDEYDKALEYLKKGKNEDIGYNALITALAYTHGLSGCDIQGVEHELLTAFQSKMPSSKEYHSLLNNLFLCYFLTKNTAKLLDLSKDQEKVKSFDSTNLYYLGWIFAYGRPFYDIDQNYRQAHHYFTLATKAGDKIDFDAYNSLGCIYMYGLNVIADSDKARQYFRLAATSQAKSTQADAEAYLGLMARHEGYGDIHDYDPRIAVSQFKKAFAITGKNPIAIVNLAEMYAKGEGVAQNLQHATALFMQIYQADKSMIKSVADQYLSGIGSIKNSTKAKLWLAVAASKGDVDAIRLLELFPTDHKHDPIRKSSSLSGKQQFLIQLESCYRFTPVLPPFIAELEQLDNFIKDLGRIWPYSYDAQYNLIQQYNIHKAQLNNEERLYSEVGIRSLLHCIDGITRSDSEKLVGLFHETSVHQRFMLFQKEFSNKLFAKKGVAAGSMIPSPSSNSLISSMLSSASSSSSISNSLSSSNPTSSSSLSSSTVVSPAQLSSPSVGPLSAALSTNPINEGSQQSFSSWR